MTAKDVCLWISIACTLAAGGAKWSALEEARVNQASAIADIRGYLTAAEGRISALEKDRVLLERIHVIEERLSVIDERTKRK